MTNSTPKPTKITVSYGNSASINTGVQYETLKPFYNINSEFDITDLSEEQIDYIRSGEFLRLKAIVDKLIIDDLKTMNAIRNKCTCEGKPIYDARNKTYTHEERCLLGSGVASTR